MIEVSNPVDLIIINNKNEILLAKRAKKDLDYNETWSIPGGGSEPNEGIEEALHREIEEELGCKIKWFKYFRSYYMKLSDTHIARAIYFYGEISGKIKLNEELSDYQWFNINDPSLLKLNFAFNQKQIINDFIKFFKQNNSS